MKSNIFVLLFFAFTFSSCKKENTASSVQIPDDKGCMEWKKVLVTDHSGHAVNNINIPIIDGLFLSNSINNSKFRYFFYSNDSVQTYFPPYTKFDDKIIRIKEFTNGLEIFNGEILFQFKNNIFNFQSGNPTSGTTLNTTPQLTVGQVRTLFSGHIEQFDHNGNQYKDSCFSAQFGYFNLNAGTNTSTENLVKAWKVTLKNKIYPSEYPVAYYQDNAGSLIYYDNGFRTFR